MAKHDIDPYSSSWSGPSTSQGTPRRPITVSVRGTVLTGSLIAEQAFFSELVEGHP